MSRFSEAVKLASSYRDKLTNLHDYMYIYTHTYSYEGISIELSIMSPINPFNAQLFRFDSYNKAYPKPRDWYDIPDI